MAIASVSQDSAFRQLRPCCVKLSQLALQARGGGKVDAKDLSSVLGELYDILQRVGRLDHALCDYVLFPLLPLFRLASSLPSSVNTKALQCMRLLLENGRDVAAKPEVSSQLLVLFMTLLQRQTAQIPRQSASEQELLALCHCLKCLLSKGKPSFPDAPPSAGAEPRLVITGNLLADLLDVASSDSVAAARLPALQSIELLMGYEQRQDVLRRFLPGLLSKLTKPSFTAVTKGVSYKSLVTSLNIISSVLPRAVRQNEKSKASPDLQKWVSSNEGHLKSAVENLSRLKNHDRTEVRNSLLGLCKALLEEKPISDDFLRLLVATTLEIWGRNNKLQQDDTLMKMFLSNDSMRNTFVQSAVQVFQNLPKNIQSPDHRKCEEAVRKAKACLYLSSRLQSDTDDMTDVVIESLTCSVKSLEGSTSTKVVSSSPVSNELTFELPDDVDIDEVYSSGAADKIKIQMIRELIGCAMSTSFAYPLFTFFSDTSQFGNSQTGISIMWTFLTSLKMTEQDALALTWRDHGSALSQREMALANNYDVALGLLKEAPLSSDWKMQALSLEVVGSYAIDAGPGFRPELSLALYPVVERLASQDERLRRHAGRNLQRITTACGYQNLQDVLLQNADYLVNAVSVRLNDSTLRPETGRVLQVAVRLGGGSMLPHLGDIMESVFSVLDHYHGYPKIVESMFSVLGAMVDQAPARERLGTDARQPIESGANNLVEEVMNEISHVGNENSNRYSNLPADHESDQDDDNEELQELEKLEKESDLATITSQTEKATTKTVEKIVRFSQYYLTYETPEIRQGLLGVLQTGLLALRHDENVLLPLVNDIWPVLISRVYDPEPYVAVGALETLSTVIQCAGDFMSTRIEDEWDRLRSFALQYRPKTNERSSSKAIVPSGKLMFTSGQRIWQAILKAVSSILTHLRINAGMEDDVFALFRQNLYESETLSEALQQLNPDYFWLVKESQEGSFNDGLPNLLPHLHDYTFPALDALS